MAASPASRSPTPSTPRTAARQRRCCAQRGLWDAIKPALVLGENIAQAAQFATTGNAVGGLIAYSLVLAPAFSERGTYALIPDVDHPPLRQRMVLLKRASDRRSASTLPSDSRPPGRSCGSTASRCRSSRPWTGPPSRFAAARRSARSSLLLPFGIWLGRLLAVHQFRGKLLVEALVTVPLVLPPTVLGLLPARHVRRPLAARRRRSEPSSASRCAFSFEGLLLASAIANIPFVVQPIQRGFESHSGRRARRGRLLRPDAVAALPRASRCRSPGPAS